MKVEIPACRSPRKTFKNCSTNGRHREGSVATLQECFDKLGRYGPRTLSRRSVQMAPIRTGNDGRAQGSGADQVVPVARQCVSSVKWAAEFGNGFGSSSLREPGS